MPGFAPEGVGFLGKLPARGDFLRAGLGSAFADAMDAWCAGAIAAARPALGAFWQAAYFEAPVWRFFLAPGVAGPEAALGLWLPSVDRVGRQFPLVIAAVASGAAALADGAAWLEAAEAAGIGAIGADWEPARLEAAIAPARSPPLLAGPAPLLPPPPDASRWWTDGSPHVRAAGFCCTGLPEAARFAAMLRDEENDADNGMGGDA